MIFSRAFMAVVALVAMPGAAFAAHKPVRVVHPPISDMYPYYIAKKHGIFARNGLDVELNTIVSSNAPAALVSGSAEVGVLTFSTLLPAVENGIDLVTVAGGMVSDKDFATGLLTRPDTDIQKPKDMIGRKVGVPGIGAAGHVLFNQWLDSKGVDFRKVVFVEVGFPQMLDALKSGAVEGVVPVDPVVTRIIDTKVGINKFPFGKDFPIDYRILASTMSRDYATKNPDVVKALRDSLQEAVEISLKDPQAARAAITDFVKLPPPVIAAMRLTPSPVRLADKDIDDWSEMLVKQGALTKPISGATINFR